jgi:hypothetical protein
MCVDNFSLATTCSLYCFNLFHGPEKLITPCIPSLRCAQGTDKFCKVKQNYSNCTGSNKKIVKNANLVCEVAADVQFSHEPKNHAFSITKLPRTSVLSLCDCGR